MSELAALGAALAIMVAVAIAILLTGCPDSPKWAHGAHEVGR